MSGCTGRAASVSPEDKLLNDYEKYIDDIIAEYEKMNAGDFDAIKNIAPLAEKGNAIRDKMHETFFTEVQEEKLKKIEEKRMDYFN